MTAMGCTRRILNNGDSKGPVAIGKRVLPIDGVPVAFGKESLSCVLAFALLHATVHVLLQPHRVAWIHSYFNYICKLHIAWLQPCTSGSCCISCTACWWRRSVGGLQHLLPIKCDLMALSTCVQVTDQKQPQQHSLSRKRSMLITPANIHNSNDWRLSAAVQYHCRIQRFATAANAGDTSA